MEQGNSNNVASSRQMFNSAFTSRTAESELRFGQQMKSQPSNEITPPATSSGPISSTQHIASSNLPAVPVVSEEATASALVFRPGELFLSSGPIFDDSMGSIPKSSTQSLYLSSYVPVCSPIADSFISSDVYLHMDESNAVKRAKEKYPWLVVIGGSCHSDRYEQNLHSLTSASAAKQVSTETSLSETGADKSNLSNSATKTAAVKRKYRRVFCAVCAQFYPMTPWASLKARKFENDSFRDHENSIHHQRAIETKATRESQVLFPITQPLTGMSYPSLAPNSSMDILKPTILAHANTSSLSSNGNNLANSATPIVNMHVNNSWMYSTYAPLATNTNNANSSSHSVQHQPFLHSQTDENGASSRQSVMEEGSRMATTTNRPIRVEENSSGSNPHLPISNVSFDSSTISYNPVAALADLRSFINTPHSFVLANYPTTSTALLVSPMEPLNHLPFMTTASADASQNKRSLPAQRNKSSLSSHHTAQRSLQPQLQHTLNFNKSRRMEQPEWLLVKGKLRHSDNYLASLEQERKQQRKLPGHDAAESNANVGDGEDSGDSSDEEQRNDGGTGVSNEADTQHITSDGACNEDVDHNGSEMVGILNNTTPAETSRHNIPMQHIRTKMKKKYRDCCCKYCAEYQPGTPWSSWKPRKYEVTVLTLHENSAIHRRAVAIHAAVQRMKAMHHPSKSPPPPLPSPSR